MHFSATQFAVEKFVSQSESAQRFHAPNLGQPLRLPNQSWQTERLPYNFISARRPQDRAPAFALRLRMRCRPRVRTRTRSRNHRRDSLRVGFSNPQRWDSWRRCSPTRQAKRLSKRLERRDRSWLFRQRFAAQAVNHSTREYGCFLRREMVRIELRRRFFLCQKIHLRE